MAVGFEKACRSLQVSEQTVAPEAVAKKIIELAQKGERDPIRMSEWTLKNLQSDALPAFSKMSNAHDRVPERWSRATFCSGNARGLDGLVSGERAMNIKPFLPNISFSPEIITLMAVAFEKVCYSLHSSGERVVEEIVAKKIIELTQRGERDPIRMKEETLKSLRMECLRAAPNLTNASNSSAPGATPGPYVE